ncbi:MAG: pyridoxamine 5'-phosphate oxidase family protein [Chloroflexota bacterium]
MLSRDDIQMSEAEVIAFLSETHTMQIATNGKDGFPHLVPMWYGFLDDVPALWTYGKSQKVLNLHRDNRLTALIETGTLYSDIRGVMLKARGVIIEEREAITRVGESIQSRYVGPLTDERRARVARQSRKRVAIALDIKQIISWDHRKLL